MRKIGILSDTHGDVPEPLLNFLEICDEVWHAGDWGSLLLWEQMNNFRPLKTVWGNIDEPAIRREMPEYQLFEVEGVKVLMIHIGGYPGRYSQRCEQLIKAHRPDLMVCGHSHILKVMRDNTYGLMHINPGAAGYKGFHSKCTAVRFNISEGRMSEMEVWEMPKKLQVTNELGR